MPASCCWTAARVLCAAAVCAAASLVAHFYPALWSCICLSWVLLALVVEPKPHRTPALGFLLSLAVRAALGPHAAVLSCLLFAGAFLDMLRRAGTEPLQPPSVEALVSTDQRLQAPLKTWWQDVSLGNVFADAHQIACIAQVPAAVRDAVQAICAGSGQPCTVSECCSVFRASIDGPYRNEQWALCALVQVSNNPAGRVVFMPKQAAHACEADNVYAALRLTEPPM